MVSNNLFLIGNSWQRELGVSEVSGWALLSCLQVLSEWIVSPSAKLLASYLPFNLSDSMSLFFIRIQGLLRSLLCLDTTGVDNEISNLSSFLSLGNVCCTKQYVLSHLPAG